MHAEGASGLTGRALGHCFAELSVPSLKSIGSGLRPFTPSTWSSAVLEEAAGGVDGSHLGIMRGRRIAVGIYPANSKSRVISGATLAMIPE